jgi:hypothetical protein
LAIKAGLFDNDLEYEKIKKRASKKSLFNQSFTPRKKVKFMMEVLTSGVQEVKLEAWMDIQSLLKAHRPVAKGGAHALRGGGGEICISTYI